MIRGILHNNQPIVSVIVGSPLGVKELVALIDTGFSGKLKLSPKEALELGLVVTHTEPITLANEQSVTMRASIAEVALENTRSTVNVIIDTGMALIGMGLLERFGYNNLNFDFDGNILTLERLGT